MNVLVVEPGFLPYEKEIDGLRDMQELVGGSIQAIYPFKETVALVCNEEGILQQLEFTSLTPEQVKTYTDRFKKAEMILAVNGGKPVIAKVAARRKHPAEKSKQTPKHPRG